VDGGQWWLYDGGAIRQIGSRRFEWYQWQCGSGSIGRVMVGQRWLVDFLEKKGLLRYGSGNRSGSGWGAVVGGWQWYHSTDRFEAVRMVPVAMWQWQYWPSYGRSKMVGGFFEKKRVVEIRQWQQEWQWMGGSNG
jgi:hypothetical protein